MSQRPKQTTVALEIRENKEPSSTAPGYIFLTPYLDFFAPADSEGYWGPHIFDQEGNLIWAGNDTVEERAWNFRPYDLNGTVGTHLCYHDSFFTGGGGFTSGTHRCFDNTYSEVERFGARADLVGPDMHELNILDNGNTLIQDIYQVTTVDLREYSGPEDGAVVGGCFQDIDLTTGDVRFQWVSPYH